MSTKRRIAVAAAVTSTMLLGLVVPAGVAGAQTFAAAAAPAADAANGWSAVTGPQARTAVNGTAQKAPTYALNSSALTSALAGAPLEHTPAAKGALPIIVIPGADGALHRFSVVDSPVMEPALASQVDFRSYAGTSVDEPGATARIDYSPALGFHATVRSPSGSWNVDPTSRKTTATYVAYRAELASSGAAQREEIGAGAAAEPATTAARPAAGELVKQRTYRLALASDPGYAAQVGAANVNASKAAVTNRLNQFYNDDLAIKFVLVGNNSLLNFNTAAEYTGPNGRCGADPCYTPTAGDDLSACTNLKIDQTAVVIPKVIGRDSFDVGQILDPGSNGGIASLASVGKDAIKASGCSGAADGSSDLLAVEFLAHELGHQFGANHTFSSASCGGFNNGTAVEIGSGASIMSYAGTCAQVDNIQQYSDPYFALTSLREMQDYITSTVDPADNGGQPAENGGSTVVTTSNHNPVVTVPTTVAIPVRTPFTLSGTVADADSGQVPVNLWEQDDIGGIRALMDNNKPDGPLFRIFSEAAFPANYETELNAPGESEATAAGSTRTFPDLAQIAAGNTNAASGTCPVPAAGASPTQQQIECFAEFLPTSARTLHFALTARDRFATGGGVTSAATTVTVAGSTPFRVTNAAASVAEGASYTVTWNVAGTTAAPFNVANVKLSYSTDGGLTFPTVLSSTHL